MTSVAGSLLLVCIYLVELSALTFALTLYRRGDRPVGVFLSSPAGLVCIGALLTLVVSGLVFAYLIPLLPSSRARQLAVPVVINLGSVVLVFGIVEGIVRALATPTTQGPVVAGTVLLPHRWEDVAARGQATLARAAVARSYLVHDRDLGWTVGPNRQSTDYNREGVERLLARLGPVPGRRAAAAGEIYVSSAEGLRSPRLGMSFAAMPAKRRIAVVGDSFTFGLEVRYEETWAHQLELALGSSFQVLNFGVDGYGVDQAYLRYRRDVVAWRPEIVILGVIDDDLRRTMCVYAFLCFPGFEMPFSKPRLVITPDGLMPVNLPLPAPASLFAKHSIAELPFLDFDGSFVPADWEWRLYHHAYAIRFVLSRYRPWSTAKPPMRAQALQSLNAEIVHAFVRLVREHGSVPIVAFFPSSSDPDARSSIAKGVMNAHGIRYLDLTACVGTVSAGERFLALHYSPRTNAAVAGCLRDAIAGGFESS
jgi:hypothetical protein